MIKSKLENDFLSFQKANQKEAIVYLLQEALDKEALTPKERCWALWNISDNLAMLRKSREQFKNHKRFEQQLSEMDKQYLHWIVSDCTQKLTLSAGGFKSYWNELYEDACKNSPKIAGNAIIRFESHRANVAIPAIIDYDFDKNHSLYALENLRESMIELKNHSNAKFYKITYLTQAMATYGLMNEDYRPFLEEAHNCFEEILSYLSATNNYGRAYLLGTWEQLNEARSEYRQATVGINNYIIQLIQVQEYKLALACNERIRAFNLNYGRYFDSKIKLAQEEINLSMSE